MDYSYDLGRLSLQPKFKSEYMRQTPFLDRDSKRSEWIGAAILLARFPVLQTTTFQAGVEQLWLRDLIQDEAEMLATGITTETGDANSINVAVQMSDLGFKNYDLQTVAPWFVRSRHSNDEEEVRGAVDGVITFHFDEGPVTIEAGDILIIPEGVA